MSSLLIDDKLSLQWNICFLRRKLWLYPQHCKRATVDKFIRLWKTAFVGNVRVSKIALMWRLLFLRCFSFVLIRHSQLCWLQGWFYCEIISLIKRSSSHEKVCVIKKHSTGRPPQHCKSTPPLSFFTFSHWLWRTREETGLPEVSVLLIS